MFPSFAIAISGEFSVLTCYRLMIITKVSIRNSDLLRTASNWATLRDDTDRQTWSDMADIESTRVESSRVEVWPGFSCEFTIHANCKICAIIINYIRVD